MTVFYPGAPGGDLLWTVRLVVSSAMAAELVRVCRPGGTIGMINWTPAGFIGQLFSTLKPYAPPAPPGASPPPLWGDEQHVREMFGDRPR